MMDLSNYIVISCLQLLIVISAIFFHLMKLGILFQGDESPLTDMLSLLQLVFKQVMLG